MVEITSSARLAHLFGWALKKHTILAFMLYTAGECTLPNPGPSDQYHGPSTLHHDATACHSRYSAPCRFLPKKTYTGVYI